MKSNLTDKEGLPGRIEYELTMLESTALNFGYRLINDGPVRQQYISSIKNASEEIIRCYKLGKYTEQEAAEIASSQRNKLMQLNRIRSSEIGRAYAVSMKSNKGVSLKYLENKYALDMFSRKFNQLHPAEKGKVHLRIVHKSGADNSWISKLTKGFKPAGQALIFLSACIIVYDVLNAKDKLKAVAYNGAVMGGGFLGGVSAGAASGLVCGPAAWACVGLGVFIGGILGATGTKYALSYTKLGNY